MPIWDRESAVADLTQILSERKERAWGVAGTGGWSPVGEFSEDSGFELMAIENGLVYTYATHNEDAAVSTAADAAAAHTGTSR